MTDKNLCISEFKNRDYYRYICALRADADFLDDILVLYCLYLELAKIKDVINQPMAGFIRLQWWRDALKEIENSEKLIVHRHHISEFLLDSGVVKKIGFDNFELLVKAREIEIEMPGSKSVEDLQNYAINTEGQLNRILQEIIGMSVDEKLAENFAISYCFAMILQSVRANAKYNRLFLPENLLQEAGVSKDDVLAGKNLHKTKDIIRKIHSTAQINLDEAMVKVKKLPKKQRVVFAPIKIAAIVLKNIKKHDYDVFMNDVSPSRLKGLFGILWF